MRLSKHQEEIAIAVARKKRMKPEEFLLKLLLEQYRTTFKKEYLLWNHQSSSQILLVCWVLQLHHQIRQQNSWRVQRRWSTTFAAVSVVATWWPLRIGWRTWAICWITWIDLVWWWLVRSVQHQKWRADQFTRSFCKKLVSVFCPRPAPKIIEKSAATAGILLRNDDVF